MSNAQQNLNNNAKHQFGDGKEMTFTQKIDFIKTKEKMVTPKEKAKELVNEYFSLITNMDLNVFRKENNFWNIDSKYKLAKQCALFCVNEIIHSIPTYPQSINSKMKRLDTITFWMLVKDEIKTYGGNK